MLRQPGRHHAADDEPTSTNLCHAALHHSPSFGSPRLCPPNSHLSLGRTAGRIGSPLSARDLREVASEPDSWKTRQAHRTVSGSHGGNPCAKTICRDHHRDSAQHPPNFGGLRGTPNTPPVSHGTPSSYNPPRFRPCPQPYPQPYPPLASSRKRARVTRPPHAVTHLAV